MQKHDQEIARIQLYLREKGITFLTPFPAKEEFFVGYLTVNKQTKQFQVTREQIGDVFNRRMVSIYLAQTFPLISFAISDIELVYNIMSLLIQKATHIECMNDNRTDFCYDDGGTGYLYSRGWGKSKRNVVRTLFQTSVIYIPCYGLDMQGRKDIDWRTLPQFQLIELLQDRKKLRIFFDFWRTVPDCDSVFRILYKGLRFPKDICDKIICLAAKLYR